MTEPTGPKKTIFVGGAPRSGTTVTHALLCTAQAVNAYHPEISFVRPVFESYAVGMRNWESHTKHFFQVPEHLLHHVRKLTQESMRHVWRVLKKPTVLCVKDPLLTPLFPIVRQVSDGPTQFITVLRHPHDVIRSRQEVFTRAGHEMTPVDVEKVVEQYLASYAHLNNPAMAKCLFHFRYEDLGNEELTDQLRAFTGLGGINPEKIWSDRNPNEGLIAQADPFYSPKYLRPLDTTRRFEPLDTKFQEVVNHHCQAIMELNGYNRDGTVESR